MNNKKILVTGGYGFIGSNFINYLIKEYDEFELVNIDYLGFGSNIDNVNTTRLDTQKITHHIKDIYSYPEYLNNEKFDYIIHFAAESHVDRSISSPVPFYESNVMGTLQILEYAKNSKSGRFIMISTDEVYGSCETGSFVETDPLNPSSPYAASKASAELICNSYIKTFGLDIIVTRCSNNFGPNQFEEKLIPKVVYNCLNNIKIPVYDEGLQKREWTYVDDHSKDILYLLRNGVSGETYNVGTGIEITNIDLVKLIMAELNAPKDLIEFVPNARLGHDFRYSIDLTKIRSTQHPNYNHEEYVKTNGGVLFIDFYHNLKKTIKILSDKFNTRMI
jgi:dTDP-glucose 4,6-dehydratase